MNARQAGFTLIELIVALMISVVLVGFIATVIALPIGSQQAQARRSELAASAEAVTQWMTRDVRGALPNSVRVFTVGGRPSAEMIDVAATTIYGDNLNFAAPDDQFDVLGVAGAAATHVVIANLGAGAQNVYAMNNIIAPAAINPLSSTIALTPPFRFTAQSVAHRRAFLISPAIAVVRYECDLAARTLRRYGNRPVVLPQAAFPAGTPSQLIASDVTACTFTRRLGNADHGGLLLIRVTISRVTNGATDTLRVMKQLKVEDAA